MNQVHNVALTTRTAKNLQDKVQGHVTVLVAIFKIQASAQQVCYHTKIKYNKIHFFCNQLFKFVFKERSYNVGLVGRKVAG